MTIVYQVPHIIFSIFKIYQINKQISEIKSFFKNVNASVYGDLDAIRELLKYINNIEKNPNSQNLIPKL